MEEKRYQFLSGTNTSSINAFISLYNGQNLDYTYNIGDTKCCKRTFYNAADYVSIIHYYNSLGVLVGEVALGEFNNIKFWRVYGKHYFV